MSTMTRITTRVPTPMYISASLFRRRVGLCHRGRSACLGSLTNMSVDGLRLPRCGLGGSGSRWRSPSRLSRCGLDAKLAVQVTQAKQPRARGRHVAEHECVTAPHGVVGHVHQDVVSGRVHECHARTIDAHDRLVRTIDGVAKVGTECRCGCGVDFPECLADSLHVRAPSCGAKKPGSGARSRNAALPPERTPDA